jgi:hypothetical protein
VLTAAFGPFADITRCPSLVRCRGQSGSKAAAGHWGRGAMSPLVS